MIDDIRPTGIPSDPPRLDYESPQTRRGQRRPPPPQSVGRLFASAAVIFCGVLALHASREHGDVAEGIGTMIIVVGLLLFVVEFVVVWWRRPR